MIKSYDARERQQRKYQIGHFWASFAVSIGCFVAVWWSPRNYVAFILMLLSTLGLASGVLDGLMGFLFVKTELRALKEFKFEIDQAAERAKQTTGSRGGGAAGLGEKLEEARRSREDVVDRWASSDDT